MIDYSTPNLPSHDFGATSDFYGVLGFKETWRDDNWMILQRGGVVLEFFFHRDVDPLTSAFSCCLRLNDIDSFYAVCKEAGLAEKTVGYPRLHPPVGQPWGQRLGAIIDLDGTLLRIIGD